MAVSAVPQPLEQAIEQASNQYGVPADLLAGIWREESGSTYPNPAVNASGYGGLFGTSDPFGSTQQQADTAASVLAAGLRESGGNVAEALSYYNSGRLQGGYTSVPGETTFGTITAPAGGAAAGLSTTGTQQASGLAGQAGAQDVSFGGDVLQGILGAPFGGISEIPGLLAGASGVSTAGVASSLEAFAVRAIEVVFGMALIGLGLAGVYLALARGKSDVSALAAELARQTRQQTSKKKNEDKGSGGGPSPPSPSPRERAAARTPVGKRSRREQRRVGFEPADARRVRAQARRRAAAARKRQADEVPF